MNITELRFNKERPRTHQVRVEVAPNAKGAHEESEYTSNGYVKTGKWFKWVDRPQLKDDGMPVIAKPYNDARFRPKERTVRHVDPETEKVSWTWHITRGGKAGLGEIHGTVGEWLDRMGATRDDIAPALAEVRRSPEYHELTTLGFHEITNAAEEKNGTLHFKGHVGSFMDDVPAGASVVVRRVLANGNIRTFARERAYHGGRGNAFHPWTMETHPHATPVERIVGSMLQGIRQLVKVQQPKFDAALRDRILKKRA
jgi:hypothetical protein